MRGNVTPILPKNFSEGSTAVHLEASPHHLLRIYQVFVNVEGLEVRIHRSVLGFIPFIKRKEFGFYAVMMLAAPLSSKPPFLLSLARETLAEEFAPLSRSRPDAWSIQQVEWRETGAAPPMFQQPGCIDQEWGAAWYELGDEAAKQHRYRLVKSRLWKGHRAKHQHCPTIEAQDEGGKAR